MIEPLETFWIDSWQMKNKEDCHPSHAIECAEWKEVIERREWLKKEIRERINFVAVDMKKEDNYKEEYHNNKKRLFDLIDLAFADVIKNG